MTHSRNLIFVLCAALLACLTSKSLAENKDPGSFKTLEIEQQMIDLDFELRSLELGVINAELAEAELEVELEKIRLSIETAERLSDQTGVHKAKLEFKKAEIRRKRCGVETELAKLALERTRKQVELIKARGVGEPAKQSSKPVQKKNRRAQQAKQVQLEKSKTPDPRVRVHIESNDAMDSVIIRGPKESVEKIRNLLKAAQKKQNQ